MATDFQVNMRMSAMILFQRRIPRSESYLHPCTELV